MPQKKPKITAGNGGILHRNKKPGGKPQVFAAARKTQQTKPDVGPKRSESTPISLAMAGAEEYLPGRDGISQSLYSEFAMCRVRGRLSANRWALPGKVRNTWFGSLVHEVLDRMYSAKRVPGHSQIIKYIDEVFEKLKADGLKASMAQEQLELHAAKAEAVLVAYSEIYSEEWAQNKYAPPEHAFDIKWGGYRLRGKIDGTFRAKDGTLWLMEHKTKGRIDVEFLMKHLAFDFQNLLYTLAHSTESGEAPRGVLYNILRTPQNKPHSGETLSAFKSRLYSEIKKDPANYFLRFPVSYTKKDLSVFSSELRAQLGEVDAVMLGELPTYRNSHACLSPFPCQYLQACSCGHMEGYERKATLFTELVEEA